MEPNQIADLIAEQNKEVRRFSSKVTRKLRMSASRFSHGKRGMVMRGKSGVNQRPEAKLKDSIGYKLYMAYAVAEGVGFKIERHGVFVHKGVGRGYIMAGGQVIRGYKVSDAVKQMAKNQNRAVNEKQATEGPMRRHPVEWFNPVLDQLMPEFADRIAAINADAVVNATRMHIK